jgi:hypothetical protein
MVPKTPQNMRVCFEYLQHLKQWRWYVIQEAPGALAKLHGPHASLYVRPYPHACFAQAVCKKPAAT